MRRSRSTNSNLRIALWASALAHLLILSGLDALAPWLHSMEQTRKNEIVQQVEQEDEPLDLSLIYVEVDPETSVEEAPENAQYYSAENTEAADMAETAKEKPEIDGSQTEVLRLMDNPSSESTEGAQAASPVIGQDAVANQGQPDAEPDNELKPSEIGGWELEETPDATNQAIIQEKEKESAETKKSALGDLKGEKTPTPRRPPRTLAEAQMQQASLESELTKQEGGSEKLALTSTVSSRSTLYGAYDAIMFRVIEKHWHAILRSSLSHGIGRVQVEFRLHSDGSISRLRVTQSETPLSLAIYCRRAIEETAPFPPWPKEMLEEVGKDYRDLDLSFHYH